MAEIDIAAVFQLLGSVASEAREFRTEMREFRDETRLRFADMEARMTGLRQTVTEYHASVLGHGMLISEMEDRIQRIERHLNLPSPAAQ